MPEAVKYVIHWGDVATWIGAIATFLAVLVALRLHTRILPPALRLSLVAPEGEATTVVITTIDQNGVVTKERPEKCRYYHVRLSNSRPWSGATDAAAQVVKVESPDASGEFMPIWTGILPVNAAHYGVHPSHTLGAAPRDFDLCSVVRGKWVELNPRIVPYNFPHRHRGEKPLRLRVTLEAHSLEVVSRIFQFEISWNGQWDDDTVKMRQHMVVRQVS